MPSARTFSAGTSPRQAMQPVKRGKPFVVLLLQDDSGALLCKWFQTRNTYLQERFPVGTRVVGSGMVTLNGYTGAREVVHPDLEVLDADDAEQVHRCRQSFFYRRLEQDDGIGADREPAIAEYFIFQLAGTPASTSERDE